MSETGFLVDCPVIKKVYIWTLHVLGSIWMQKFSQRDPVLPYIDHIQTFSFSIIFFSFFGLLWISKAACLY